MRRVASLDSLMLKKEREELRAALVTNPETGQEDFLRFQAQGVRKFGPAGGLLIRQLVFWTGKGMDPEGWIYKTRSEIEQELGLSQRQQDKGRKALKAAGVIEEDLRVVATHGYYRVTHYRVALQKLIDVLEIPYSTLNQWKRGLKYERDPETGRYDRKGDRAPKISSPPEQATPDASLTVTESHALFDNRDSEASLGLIHSDVPLSNSDSDALLDNAGSGGSLDLTDSGVSPGVTDSGVSLDTSESATESTPGENLRENGRENFRGNNRGVNYRELTGDADAINCATPPPKNLGTSTPDEGEGSTRPCFDRTGGEDEQVKRVRQIMKNGRHTPVALKHYRSGHASVQDVAEHVSQDATGYVDAAEILLPTVQSVLEEMGETS